MSIDGATLTALTALACFAIAAISLGAIHILPSGVDPIADGVSAYALGRTAPGYGLQAIASGLGGLALAVALAERAPSWIALTGLVVYGLTRIAIVRYPTDARGSPMTTTGRRHALLAAAAFLALAIAAPAASWTMGTGALSNEPAGPLIALAGLTTIAALGSFAVAAMPATVGYYGLAQRAFYVASFAWALAMSLALLID